VIQRRRRARIETSAARRLEGWSFRGHWTRLRSSSVRVVKVHRETNREFLSPYVRRVAVTLNILELPFELQELSSSRNLTSVDRMAAPSAGMTHQNPPPSWPSEHDGSSKSSWPGLTRPSIFFVSARQQPLSGRTRQSSGEPRAERPGAPYCPRADKESPAPGVRPAPHNRGRRCA
jgi:hypothetical protein